MAINNYLGEKAPQKSSQRGTSRKSFFTGLGALALIASGLNYENQAYARQPRRNCQASVQTPLIYTKPSKTIADIDWNKLTETYERLESVSKEFPNEDKKLLYFVLFDGESFYQELPKEIKEDMNRFYSGKKDLTDNEKKLVPSGFKLNDLKKSDYSPEKVLIYLANKPNAKDKIKKAVKRDW